eukprot:Nk52_evm10s360 gene=Nk52_evmTU10s360
MAFDSKIPNAPALIEYKSMRFIIMDAPSNSNVKAYVTELLKNNVTDVVRVCDPTYNKTVMEQNGINVWDWPFEDGEAPPTTIIKDWLELVEQRFYSKGASEKKACIACHCVAGLGRAPVIVALALIEAGLSPEDTIEFIRQKRRGAINSKQIKFLQKYKPRSKKQQCTIL